MIPNLSNNFPHGKQEDRFNEETEKQIFFPISNKFSLKFLHIKF